MNDNASERPVESTVKHGNISTDGGHTNSDERYVVGLMAGTSLDGVDAACCRVVRESERPFGYDVTVESFVTTPYEDSIRERLVTLCDDDTGRIDEACRLNRALGLVCADAATEAIAAAGLDAAAVDAIASHGQTVWHIPDRERVDALDRSVRSTLQIGDGATIASETGIRTISDFRAADVAAGGHGAPLASFLDATLFAGEQARALQNIGGIGNCTFLPPNPDRDEIRAFDTGPGNMVIDAVVEILSDGERTYDEDGRQAARGTPSDELVDRMLDAPYFAEEPPKTTGRELFGHEYARDFIDAGRERGLSEADIVASATMLTARSIAQAYERFADPYPEEMLVSGGGAYNDTLLSYLRDELTCPVSPLDHGGIGPDNKEAALFALLGATRLDGVANTVPAATGADRPVVMGKVSQP
ncbi:anhydro-N-acetylmuramic acid kinase [Halovenus marina]|uniref:anhydro-N-acetylmuramic acid kinase n=1 Tax=Halovenus marina TaxID=3396621 RepID=UPI003F549C06